MNIMFPRLITLSGICMSISVLWDGWWHIAVGRDEFWIAPHLLLYVSLISLTVISFFEWKRTKKNEYRNLFLLTFLVPISGILDQIWHSIFGTENLISAMVVWSLPHMILFSSLFYILIYIRKIIAFELDTTLRWFLECGIFSALLGLVLIVVAPLYPLGSYHVIGFWGAGFVMLVFTLFVMYSQSKLKQPGTAILVTSLFCLFSSFGPPDLTEVAPHILVLPFYNPPLWLFSFSLLTPALFLEISYRYNLLIRGVISGLISSSIFYFTALHFTNTTSYGTPELIIALLASGLGGLASGVLLKIFNYDSI